MYDVGSRIKLIRQSLGMTQSELAKKMSVSKQAISKAESGNEDLSTTRVRKFADALGVTPGYIMGWELKDGSPRTERAPEPSKHQKILMAYNELDPTVQQVVDKILGLDGD